MAALRLMACGAALAIALTPLAALAADTSSDHMQSELTNAQAQYAIAQQTADDLQAQAQQEATNARMVALLHSEAMRERQLTLVANANALEQLAATLADAARAQGEISAQNTLAIAHVQAATLVANLDLKLANAEMLSEIYGRSDELSNARAQSDLIHQVANFISGQQAESDMSNARQIGEMRADAIHTPAIVQQQNGIALGANELLAADTALQAGELQAGSIVLVGTAKADALRASAAEKLHNAQVRANAL
jgi:uncharacterized surface anchored protein